MAKFNYSCDNKTAVQSVKRALTGKLAILKENNVVRSVGLNPKYWKFDNYNFQRMDEDDDIFRLLCSFDDVDFDRYFCY